MNQYKFMLVVKKDLKKTNIGSLLCYTKVIRELQLENTIHQLKNGKLLTWKGNFSSLQGYPSSLYFMALITRLIVEDFKQVMQIINF
jgi:hypothetical protein